MRSDLALLTTAEGLACVVMIPLLVVLVFLPYNFLLGFWRGLAALAGTLLGLLIAITALVEPVHREAGEPGIMRNGALQSVGRRLIQVLGSLRDALGTPLFVASVGVCAAALTSLSLLASLKAYERRDL